MTMTSKDLILKVAVNKPLFTTFDYLPPEVGDIRKLQRGARIQVPFGRSKLTGVIVEVTHQSDLEKNKLRRALEGLDDTPTLSESMMELCSWASNYYHHPIGEVLYGALPPILKKGKEPTERSKNIKASSSLTSDTHQAHKLNQAQQKAVDSILTHQHQFAPILLEGVTGSGKTEVYCRAIEEVINQGKQALVLVPEIGLTPQTFGRFEKRFNHAMATFHSGMTDRQRLNAWKQMKSGEGKILVGTRSAIFSDIPNLGLIVIDEEHDGSFKQQEGLRYSARDLAMIRGQKEQVPVVLGSATPSLETLQNALQGRYLHLTLPKRAGTAKEPAFTILDCKKKRITGGMTDALLRLIHHHLDSGNQVLLFINRRGYAPQLLCHRCGWSAKCNHCDAKMTFHLSNNLLHCHHCDSKTGLPPHCPTCKEDSLITAGIGTERVEAVLNEKFPDYPVLRIDSDTTRKKGSLETFLEEIRSEKPHILIGTQMLAKGHHFPNVTLVAILNIDNNLLSSDFRNMERLGQLVLQVAGRAGRAEKPGEVILQTHFPNHPLLTVLIREGYGSFAQALLAERQATNLPPFSHCALLRASAKTPSLPSDFLRDIQQSLLKWIHEQRLPVNCLGPIPAPMLRKADQYRGQLFMHSSNRPILQKVLKQLIVWIQDHKMSKRLHWSLDVDPSEMF